IYSILYDLPFFFAEEAWKTGQRKLEFQPEVLSRFEVMPRYGDNYNFRWFEASLGHILPSASCFKEGNEVVMDACISLNPRNPAVGHQCLDRYQKITEHLDKHNTQTHMYRWRFNMITGETKEEEIDDEVTEFPVVSNKVLGYQYRYS